MMKALFEKFGDRRIGTSRWCSMGQAAQPAVLIEKSRERHWINDQAGAADGPAEAGRRRHQHVRLYKRVQDQAEVNRRVDGLFNHCTSTSVWSTRSSARRYVTLVPLPMIDLDDFKVFNDRTATGGAMRCFARRRLLRLVRAEAWTGRRATAARSSP